METAKVVGCFVLNADVAERLFAAGIPYWFIRPISSFVKENILSITSIVQPQDKLELVMCTARLQAVEPRLPSPGSRSRAEPY